MVSPTASEQDLREARIFSEPLIPIGHPPSIAENLQLAAAVTRFQRRSIFDDYSALENFLRDNPDSAWTPAIQFNLANEYYNTGWYSKCLKTWEEVWPKLNASNDPTAKPMADRAAGELAYMYGRLGRMTELAALLNTVKDRTFIGSATERIAGAKQGLWTMQHMPEIAFRCGPFALDCILNMQHATNAGCSLIRDSVSTTNGCSLNQVSELSRQLGMNFQMAYRDPGAELLMPAVVNWKVGHYAALIAEENGLYHLQDPTFGNDTWTSRRALDAESSGYFLVPAGTLPKGWRTVSSAEGRRIFGKGSTSTSDPDSTTGQDPSTDCPPDPLPYAGIRGMAVPDVHLMVVSLHLRDAPVGYSPPVGLPVFFTASYNQREAGQPATFNYSNLGPKWTFNWLAYVKDNPSATSADVSYYTDGGGSLPFSGFASSVRDSRMEERITSTPATTCVRFGK